MRILGIETSCDETAAAVVDGSAPSGTRLLSHRLLSQTAEHAAFGGVVPEIAARSHLDHVDRLVGEAMGDAGLSFDAIDGVAVTAGPGLIGGVIVGVMTAKAIAAVTGKPFLGVNHLEGHALSVRLEADVPFPYLLLLVSGGHCQLLSVDGVGRYRRLGGTLDDAVGEAFDKTAKMLGLGFPGGPAVERAARAGDAKRFALPRPMLGRPGCDFSFSGLKTAVRQAATALAAAGAGGERDVADLCASFQAAVAAVLADRARHAMRAFERLHEESTRTFVVAGGVAANAMLRASLEAAAASEGFAMAAPPPWLCTDNGAMIAWAGAERLRLGLVDSLDLAPRPRWPLDELSRAAG
ncbi:MAG: tRNA (adenosine(37)-N6)-threonylcarbamoyltransferase complex transferase subunit TsaD [Alphaproteobacteria bacterium]|nr:tRNA (adenosine(37)-N6)-threonylcarbamoyltransferase complex transferase subunit TsaD [Alphaproteobacteria bacterium]